MFSNNYLRKVTMPKFIWNIISYILFDIKAQRKNFYKGIHQVGFKEYMRLKKVVPTEFKTPKDFKYNVSIVAIAKNESTYFKEWIEYHKLIGIEHFYIYDNGSTDNTKDILAPYIQSGLVTFTYFPGKERQGLAYNDAIAKYKNETRWLCILDLDEFICFRKHNNINEFLENFKDCFQVSLRWMYYGSSGHIQQPEGLVIENFTKHAKECSFKPKSIFNPRAAIDALQVHYVIGVGKWVDEHHKLYSDKNPSVDVAQINHYFIKSKDDFINRKVVRGTNYHKHAITDIEKTFTEFDLNDVDDDIMQKYTSKLHKLGI